MDLEIIILSEVNQTEKKKKTIASLICGILKSDTNELIYKQKQSHRHRNQCMVTKGEGEGEINKKFGINRYTPLYIQ